MSTEYVERSIQSIGHADGLDLLPYAVRLLSEGEPVALERVAAAAGWSVAEVDAALAAQPGTERDDRGRLVGFGLTLRPTGHRFTVGGRTLFTWCASDALMFPVMLGRDALVESTCPRTGRTIRIAVTSDGVQSVDPRDAVMSVVRPAGVRDVRSAICQHGHFFSSPAAASRWTEQHPDGAIYSVADAFRLDREVVRQLGWDTP